MSWPLVFLYAGLVAASLTVATYGIWTARWARRGATSLAVMNGLVALAGVLLIVTHLWSLTTPALTEFRLRRIPIGLLYADLLFLFPAITRLMELRRDKLRDATRIQVAEAINAATTATVAESKERDQ